MSIVRSSHGVYISSAKFARRHVSRLQLRSVEHQRECWVDTPSITDTALSVDDARRRIPLNDDDDED